MESRKERVIKILKRVAFIVSLGFNAIFIVALIIGGVASKKKGNNVSCALAESPIQEKVEFKQDNKKYVSYNEEGNYISFEDFELNTYNWSNFSEYFYTNNLSIQNVLTQVICNNFNVTQEPEDDYIDNLEFSYSESGFENQLIWFEYNRIDNSYTYKISFFENKFEFIQDYNGTETLIPFGTLELYFNSSYYDAVKSAIELDIQYNTATINSGIFETLTESSVAFISSIGSGIGYMTAIFYDSANSQLTTIGLLSVIVVAVSLSYFLFRLIIGLIRMRG